MKCVRGLLEGIVLPKGIQCWGEGVPLFTAFALANVAATPRSVPPTVRGGATVKEAYERQQLRDYLTQFAEKRCAGHAVVRASAVQRDQHGTRARLKSGAHVGRQCVGSGAGLQSKLERPRGLVKLGGPLPGERFGDQAAERVTRRDTTYTPVWFA